MPVAAAVLQRLALLHGLPTEALDTLGKYMSLHTFARRAVVLNRGEEGHGLGFCSRGDCRGWTSPLMGARSAYILWRQGIILVSCRWSMTGLRLSL